VFKHLQSANFPHGERPSTFRTANEKHKQRWKILESVNVFAVHVTWQTIFVISKHMQRVPSNIYFLTLQVAALLT
jgi:hypothetical protein